MSTRPFPIPAECPLSGRGVKKDENGVYMHCVNANCTAKLKQRLQYFVGRGQMDIENFGPALIEQLVDKGLVGDFADLYRLRFDRVAQLERMADKSAANVMESIEKSKTQDLWRLIAALGIRNVGGQSAEILADEFGSLEKLMDADEATLEAIDQIGPVMAKSIYDYLHDDANRDVIRGMLAAGVKPKAPPKKGSVLAGKTIVVTGTLENLTRQQIQQAIKDNGGKASSSVSKKTDFVLAGANAGSKLDKAKQLGVQVIDEAQFMAMIGL